MIKHQTVDWKYVFSYMDEAFYWADENYEENKLPPDNPLTTEEFEKIRFEEVNWEWIFEFWGVPCIEVDPSESVQSVCKYIAQYTHVLKLETNQNSLFSCWPSTFFLAIRQHVQQAEPDDEITPATKICSLSGKKLYQAYSEILRSLPVPEITPIDSRLIYSRPGEFRQWLYYFLNEPIELLPFLKKVILPIVIIETLLACTFPELSLILLISIIIASQLLGILIHIGSLLSSDSHKTPQNLKRMSINNAPTLKEMCKQLSAGLTTT